ERALEASLEVVDHYLMDRFVRRRDFTAAFHGSANIGIAKHGSSGFDVRPRFITLRAVGKIEPFGYRVIDRGADLIEAICYRVADAVAISAAVPVRVGAVIEVEHPTPL